MTKAEAEAAMRDGKKVTHIIFTKDEWLYMVNGIIHDENDYIWGNVYCEAWTMRTGGNWDKGWSIKE